MKTLSKEILDQEMDALRGRMRLLQQERLANVDLFETTKAANSDEIRALREENKELRQKLTQLQKLLSVDKTGHQSELSRLRKEAIQLRSEYDTLKVTSNSCKRQLNKLEGELNICELESSSNDQGSSSKIVKVLENKFDKVMIKYNEAQSIRNTYEHIVRRLKDERLSFNNQLTALERTLKAKKRDVDELLQLSGDAHHAKEVAQHELHQARHLFEQKRAKREGELRERQQVLKIRRQMIEKQERRAMKKNDSIHEKNVGENQDDTSVVVDTSYTKFYDKELEEEQIRKLLFYEESFDKIKAVTGVTFLGDIIDKIKSQKESALELQQLTKQNQDFIEKLKKQKLDLLKRAEEKKLQECPVGSNRKVLDEKQDCLSESALQVTKAKKRLESMLEITMAAKSGIKNLCQKLMINNIDCHPASNLNGEEDCQHYSSLLWAIGDDLVKMMAKIREKELNYLHDMTLEENSDHADNLSSSNINAFSQQETVEELHNRPYNQRIKLPSWNASLTDDDSQSENSVNNIEDMDLSRFKLKNISTRMARTQKRLQKTEEANKVN